MAVYQLTVRLTHTTGTHVPCSLFAHLEYNDTAHNTLYLLRSHHGTLFSCLLQQQTFYWTYESGAVIPTNRYVPIGGKQSLKIDPRQMHETP